MQSGTIPHHHISHIIENGTIQPGPAKIAALFKKTIPTSVTQIRSFLGLAQYYKKFIQNFAAIASPLYLATSNGNKFTWNPECTNAFHELRESLSTTPILQLPQFDQPFRLETDASGYAAGGVLSQQINGDWKPVAYFSKHFSRVQRSYSATSREMLALVLAVEHFKQFLYGIQFDIITDHEPLKYMLKLESTTPQLMRLLARLDPFDFAIQYRKGTLNGNADALSRMNEEADEDELAPENDEIIINALQFISTHRSDEQMQDVNIL